MNIKINLKHCLVCGVLGFILGELVCRFGEAAITGKTVNTNIDPEFFLGLFVIAFVLGALAEWVIGKYFKKIEGLSIERFVMALSLIFLVASAVCSVRDIITELSAVGMSVFSSVVFSWLLTRENSKAELKAQEQELALKSYRHINYLETVATTAEKIIDKYVEESESSQSSEIKQLAVRAKDQIGYIRGGITTCKMDWVDLLAETDKPKCTTPDSVKEYGKMVVDQDALLNQEDV